MFCEQAWEQYLSEVKWEMLGINGEEKKIQFVRRALEQQHYSICRYSIVTMDMILQNPTFPWLFESLSFNRNVTWDIIQRFPDKNWKFDILPICSDHLTFEIIHQNQQFPWNPSGLRSITWDIVESHPEVEWNYSHLSANENITWEIIQAHPDKPWDYDCMSMNPKITWDIVQQHPEKPWNYRWFARHPSVTFDIFVQHCNGKFDWRKDARTFVMKNPNMNFDQVIPYFQFDMNRYQSYCLSNPSITFEKFKQILHILKKSNNSRYVQAGRLLDDTFEQEIELNPFTTEKQQFVEKCRTERNALYKEFHEHYFHPSRWEIICQHGHV